MAKLTFELPQGVELPDGLAANDTFQCMATFKLLQGGMATLTQVDGETINGQGQGPQDQAKPTDDVTQSAIPAMFGAG